MSPVKDEPLKLEDVQGVVVRNYRDLPHAYFVALTFPDDWVERTRAWLNQLRQRVTRASMSNAQVAAQGMALNVAFTVSGMRALGLDDPTIQTFPRELIEGMATPHRQRLLGDDQEATVPQKWRWGGPATARVDGMLFVYADGEQRLDRLLLAEIKAAADAGIKLATAPIKSSLLGNKTRKEHFGFDDGISQPYLRQFDSNPEARSVPADDQTPLGEVLLGYNDVYEQLPESPSVPADQATKDVGLPVSEGRCDLGRNGSYVVFRQLAQDVRGFWRYLDHCAEGDTRRRQELAEKIVGRKTDGRPLASHRPARQDQLPYGEEGNEEYQGDVSYARDPRGEGCPLASHIRRSNPRDGLGKSEVESRLVAQRHRLLRRGRPYGRPVDPGFDIDKIVHSDDDQAERGMNFITFNTDIGRQFEFVQRSWVNSVKFNGLYNEADPLVSPRAPGCTFSMPTTGGIRRRLTELPRFITIRGGAYLFLPGMQALAYLGSPLRFTGATTSSAA
jgi:Dyp-type peroxidase family